MNMEDDPGLGFAVHWIQQALISVYENNCPLKPVRRGGNSGVDIGVRVPQNRSETAL
jgi:hypothetical protein